MQALPCPGCFVRGCCLRQWCLSRKQHALQLKHTAESSALHSSAFLKDSVQTHPTIWLHEGAPAPQLTSCQLRSPAIAQQHFVTYCV